MYRPVSLARGTQLDFYSTDVVLEVLQGGYHEAFLIKHQSSTPLIGDPSSRCLLQQETAVGERICVLDDATSGGCHGLHSSGKKQSGGRW